VEAFYASSGEGAATEVSCGEVGREPQAAGVGEQGEWRVETRDGDKCETLSGRATCLIFFFINDLMIT
jgi:hypothetical protein